MLTYLCESPAELEKRLPVCSEADAWRNIRDVSGDVHVSLRSCLLWEKQCMNADYLF